MDSESSKITKLVDAKQWTIWKFQVKIVLQSIGAWNVVNGTEKEPKRDSSNTKYETELAEFNKKDVNAQRVIVTTVGEQPLLHIVNCTHASEMWSKLQTVFEQKSKSGIHFLYQKFFLHTKSDEVDMAGFISQIEEIVKQLSDLDTKIPDSMVVTKILMSLPPTYNHFHSAWESTAEANQTLEHLRTRLMIEEKRLNSQETSDESSAFFVKKSKNKKWQNNKNKDKKPGKCFVCGKGSHWKKDCPERSNQSSTNALIGDSCMLAIDYENSWFLDSGATEHMSKRREWFTNYVQLEQPHNITIGNGSKMQAVGKGDIEILCYNGKDWLKRTMLDVLYVPVLHTNLFSQGKVTDKNYVIVCDNGKCVIKKKESKKEGEIVAMGVRETGLYKMLIRKEHETTAFTATKSVSIRMWHENFAHQNVAHVKHFLRLRNIPYIDEKFQCEACIFGKHHRAVFKERTEKSKECGEITHVDVCGPMHIKSLGGARYFLLLKDDYSHYRTVYFLKQKSEVVERMKEFVTQVHVQTNYTIKVIRSDNGGEIDNKAIRAFCAREGLIHQLTAPYTPEQNGTLERENRTVVEAARTQLHAHDTDLRLWAEAVSASVYVLNRTGTSTVKDKTPFQLWHNKDADIHKLKEFGSIVYTHIPKEKRKKLEKKATKCLLVGYSDNGYRVFNTETKNVQVSRDLVFSTNVNNVQFKCSKDCIENGAQVKQKESKNKKENKKEKNKKYHENRNENSNNKVNESVIVNLFPYDDPQNMNQDSSSEQTNDSSDDLTAGIEIESTSATAENETTNASSEREQNNDKSTISNTSELTSATNANISSDDSVIFVDSYDTSVDETSMDVNNGSTICNVTQRNIIESRTRSGAQSSNVESATALLGFSEPQTYDEALNSPDKDHWISAMNDEFNSLIKNGTWILTELPKGEKAIDNRWVFKVKTNTDGSIDRYKARLVVKGYTQRYGVNYTETFSPVVRYSTVRSILAFAAINKMCLKQFDIKTAFLNGDLEETVFMKQPTGYSDGSNKVCKLVKSLYGLKQASRCWNKKFTKFLKEFKFVQSDADPCLFIRKQKGDMIVLAIYVDDGLLVGTNEMCFGPVIEFLRKHFEVKEFEAKCFLRLQIEQKSDGSIQVCQEAYTKRIIERFGMTDSFPVATPIDNHRNLEAKVEGKATEFPYREAVGSLLYLANGTRPDICFAVNFMSRFVENPNELHVRAVKRIIKYLKGTLNFGLVYFSDTNYEVLCYSDADYAGCLDTRKSTTGYCITMGGSIINWCSERQGSVSLSTTESEYMAASQAVRELVWMKRLLQQLIGPFSPFLMIDNTSASKLIKNPEQHKRTKHIDVRYHFIREKFIKKVFNLREVSSHDQLADIFTKPMPEIRVNFLRDALNVKSF